MGVWTALILASQLLLNLHVEAQALSEFYLKCFHLLFTSKQFYKMCNIDWQLPILVAVVGA